MADAYEVGIRVARALERAGLPYAVGGALALGAHGAPRGTLDVDMNVFVEAVSLPATLAALREAGMDVDADAAQGDVARRGMFVGMVDGLRVDVFVPSIPFSWEAARTRVEMPLPEGGTAWFLSAEALLVFKLLFFRPKDLIDIARLAAFLGDRLDRAYVRAAIVEMMGDDDERVVKWDQIVAHEGHER